MSTIPWKDWYTKTFRICRFVIHNFNGVKCKRFVDVVELYWWLSWPVKTPSNPCYLLCLEVTSVSYNIYQSTIKCAFALLFMLVHELYQDVFGCFSSFLIMMVYRLTWAHFNYFTRYLLSQYYVLLFLTLWNWYSLFKTCIIFILSNLECSSICC